MTINVKKEKKKEKGSAELSKQYADETAETEGAEDEKSEGE